MSAMRAIPEFAAMILALAMPITAQGAANVYRCVDRGAVTYQDMPCGTQDGAKLVLPDSPAARSSNPEDLDRLRKRVDAMTYERRQREIEAELADIERRLAALNRDQAAEIDAIKGRQQYIAATVPSYQWDRGAMDQAIAEEMKAVAAKYRARTDAAQRRLLQLRNEQSALTPPPR
jgi:hypothetical protein